MSYLNKNNEFSDNKQEVFSITYEEIGFFPRSFSRVLDRFLKQVFSDVENLVIQEYRFYRYLFLTTLKCLLILFFVPFFVHFLTKTYIVRPLTEYFWNTKQTEIFLNSYQQKRAFSELKEFEEKTYFESLIFPKSAFTPNFNFLQETNSSSIPLLEDSPTMDFAKEKSFPLGNIYSVKAEPNLESSCSSVSSAPCSYFQESNSQSEKPFFQNNDLPLGEKEKNLVYFNSKNREDVGDKLEEKNISFIANHTPLSFFSTIQAKGEEKLIEGAYNENLKGISNLQEASFSKKTNSVEKTQSKEEERGINEKPSLFVYQTQEADKNIQKRYQEKTIELAQKYNDQSIEAITNFFADLISLLTLFYLLYALEIQINITKSFLLEVFFGLDDSKKSLLILLITDLLVGYHSSNLWELFFEFLFHHYGLPESQTGIFLLVATLPVLLDVLFKYLIFRHLNRSSPATVATYHAMIE